MPCPLTDCRNPEVEPNLSNTGADVYDFNCPLCGSFALTKTFYVSYEGVFAQQDARTMEGLRRYIRFENSNDPPRRPVLCEKNWEQRADEFKPSRWGKFK